MKKLIFIIVAIVGLTACNDNNENAENNKQPNKVHPVSETIPDSLKLEGDSTMVPDLTPGNGSAGTNDDSAKSR